MKKNSILEARRRLRLAAGLNAMPMNLLRLVRHVTKQGGEIQFGVDKGQLYAKAPGKHRLPIKLNVKL